MRIVIFANGVLPNFEAAKKLLRPGDFLLGVDGGTRFILQLGLMPNLVMGDLDSLEEDYLENIKSANIPTRRYPADKNETDLELAIRYALDLHPDAILIVSALGGRIDQTLANIFLLADSPFSQIAIRLDDGIEELFFCRDNAQLTGAPGDTVSLIPWNGEVTGIVTSGLKWKLEDETLLPYKTRGVSNEMTGGLASINIQSGLLLVIHRRQNQ